jgi:hypothetical protein
VVVPLVVLAIVAAFVALRPWYAADRYERLRDHRSRAQRFAIEEHIDAAVPVPGRLVLLVTIDGLDPETWGEAAAPGTRTLDSLRARGRSVTVIDGDDQAALATALARAAHAAGARALAVPGRVADLDGAPALASAFTEVVTDWPPVTDYLDEGAASWVSLRAIEWLERGSGGAADAFVWVRYADLLPPLVAESRFEVPRRANERVAIEHYLGRLLAYARGTHGADDTVVAITDESARNVVLVTGDGDPATAIGPVVGAAELGERLFRR